MKKIKEINLTIDTSRYSSPHVRGRIPYLSGNSGGMTNSADSSYSSYMGSKKFMLEEDEEEEEETSEEELNIMPENILSRRVRTSSGCYSLKETLSMLNENITASEEKDYIYKMSKLHNGIITDIIDFAQRFIEAIPVAGPFDELSSFAGGQIAQYAAGNVIGQSAIKKHKLDNPEALAGAITKIYKPLEKFQGNLIKFLTLGQAQPLIDGFNTLGELGIVIVKSSVNKSSLYKPGFFSFLYDFAGDAFHASTSAVDITNITGIAKGGALAWWNLQTLEDLVEDSRILLSKYYEESGKSSPYEIQSASTSPGMKIDNMELKDLIDRALEQGMMAEVYEYGIDEDIDEDLYEDEDLDEYSGSVAAGMSALPLGTKVGNASKTGGQPSIYTTKDQKKFRKYANKTVGSIAEVAEIDDSTKSIIYSQAWSHKTLGKIKFK